MPDKGAQAARRNDVDNMVDVRPKNWEDGEDESESEAKSSGRNSATLIMRGLGNPATGRVSVAPSERDESMLYGKALVRAMRYLIATCFGENPSNYAGVSKGEECIEFIWKRKMVKKKMII